MSDTWEPKPGDIVYQNDFDIDPDDKSLTDLESYQVLARVVVRLADGRLYTLPIDGDGLLDVNLTDGEPFNDEISVAVAAVPFRRGDYERTLAGAIRAQAEADISFYGRSVEAARRVLALADRLDAHGGAE